MSRRVTFTSPPANPPFDGTQGSPTPPRRHTSIRIGDQTYPIIYESPVPDIDVTPTKPTTILPFDETSRTLHRRPATAIKSEDQTSQISSKSPTPDLYDVTPTKPEDLTSKITSFRENGESKDTRAGRYRRGISTSEIPTTPIASLPSLDDLPKHIVPRPQSCLRLYTLLPLIQKTISARREMGPIYRASFPKPEAPIDNRLHNNLLVHTLLTNLREGQNIHEKNTSLWCQECLEVLVHYGNLSVMRKGKLIPLIWPTKIEPGPADYYADAIEAVVGLWDSATVEALDEDVRGIHDGDWVLFDRDEHFRFEIAPMDQRWHARTRRRLISCENSICKWFPDQKFALSPRRPETGFGEKEPRHKAIRRYCSELGKWWFSCEDEREEMKRRPLPKKKGKKKSVVECSLREFGKLWLDCDIDDDLIDKGHDNKSQVEDMEPEKREVVRR